MNLLRTTEETKEEVAEKDFVTLSTLERGGVRFEKWRGLRSYPTTAAIVSAASCFNRS